MSNKRYDQFTAGTPTDSNITLFADPTTGALNKCTLATILALSSKSNTILKAVQAAGSPVIQFMANSFPPYNLNAIALTNSTMFFNMVYLDACTVTGIMFSMNQIGYYDPINYNGVALYSVSGGTLTLIAYTPNSTTIFSGSVSAQIQHAFNAPVTVAAGLYYVAFLSNLTTPTQLPVLWSLPANDYNLNMNWLQGNSLYIGFKVASKTTLPSTVVPATDSTGYGGIFAAALY